MSTQTIDRMAVEIEGEGDAVIRMAKVLGVERAHFAGHSMGTIVCQKVALEEPRLARSLMLVGPLLAPPDQARYRRLDARETVGSTILLA